jgi:hypothetical protein
MTKKGVVVPKIVDVRDAMLANNFLDVRDF